MSKKILILFLLSVFCFAGAVWAQPNIGLDTASNIAAQSGLPISGASETGLAETIGRYINILLGFTGMIFMVLTLYAGYLWMFGGGNEENIAQAKKTITSSIIGLAVILLSYSITALIMWAVAGTTKPEPYGELELTGPSTYTGCCFVATPGCTKTLGVGRAEYTVPCGKCRENMGSRDCSGDTGKPKGKWFTDGCTKAQNDNDFICTDYEFSSI